MHRFLSLAALVASGCGGSDAPPDAILGIWRLAGTSTNGNACDDAPPETEYTADGTVVTRSGAQRLAMAFSLEPEGDGYMLSQRPISHNGELSCAGNPPEFVLTQPSLDRYVEIDGDQMTVYLNGPGSPSAGMVRVRPAGTASTASL